MRLTRNPIPYVIGFLAALIALSFVMTARTARCDGLCGAPTCHMGIGCINGCSCIMSDGIHGYCARVSR